MNLFKNLSILILALNISIDASWRPEERSSAGSSIIGGGLGYFAGLGVWMYCTAKYSMSHSVAAGTAVGTIAGGIAWGALLGYLISKGVLACHRIYKEKDNIYLAIDKNDIAKIKRILKSKPELKNEYGPLTHALKWKKCEIALLLCQGQLTRVTEANLLEYQQYSKIVPKLYEEALDSELKSFPKVLIDLILEYIEIPIIIDQFRGLDLDRLHQLL